MTELSNFEVARKAEMKRVVRCFQRYDTDQISLLYSHPGNPCRKALDRGEFYYVHPDVPNRAFPTRSRAADYALRQAQ